MAEWLIWMLLVISLALIAGLVLSIKRQLRELRQSLQQQKALLEERQRQHKAVVDSIQILARSILADQVEYSEACIRIKVLLDIAAPELQEQPPFQVFDLVYRQLRTHPTHEARQTLSRSERKELDQQRWDLEETHQQAIREAAEALLRQPGLS